MDKKNQTLFSQNIGRCCPLAAMKLRNSDTDREEIDMRLMILVKAERNSEVGVMPSEQLLTEMGGFNQELVKAGVMLAGEGLQPS
jgi:hypothetical protein